MNASPENIHIVAFYRFMDFEDYATYQSPLLDLCQEHAVKGTILLAKEGINATIAGSANGIERVLDYIREHLQLADLEVKLSFAAKNPFYRMKVRLKAEIIKMGNPEANPVQQVGKYVDAEDWNTLIKDPEVCLIDTRNDYEVRTGSFPNAVNPGTRFFSEFPAFVNQCLDPDTHKKVALFCTGGIRCEKATAYLLAKGFQKVYHLKGGVLKYLETVPREDNLWKGECFVFDNRVTVDHNLQQGSYDVCIICLQPITAKDKASPQYERGVSCPYCYNNPVAQRREQPAVTQKDNTSLTT